jgi:hypothetical protein
METFLLKLAVAVIPLILLVTSVTVLSPLFRRSPHHHLTRQRARRQMLRSLSYGVHLH